MLTNKGWVFNEEPPGVSHDLRSKHEEARRVVMVMLLKSQSVAERLDAPFEKVVADVRVGVTP